MTIADLPKKATATAFFAVFIAWLQAETPSDAAIKYVLFAGFALFLVLHFLSDIAHLRWGKGSNKKAEQ